MKIKELREMPEADLKKQIVELRKELMKQNAQVATGTVPKSPGMISSARRTIARIKTILRERSEAKNV